MPCSAATSALRPLPHQPGVPGPHPHLCAGYWLFGFASKKYHPIDDLDAAAWKALNMRTRYYTTRLHVGAFYLPAFLEEMLREVEEH